MDTEETVYTAPHDDILSSMPYEIFDNTNLEEIDLRGWVQHRHQVREIPTKISRLTNLQKLRLGFNNLSSLPEELFLLTKLSHLELDNNPLSCFPASITKLQELTVIRVTVLMHLVFVYPVSPYFNYPNRDI